MILLDTNVLEADSFKTLDGPLVGALLAVAKAKDEDVLLPEVVQQEFLAHRRREVEEAVETAQAAIKRLLKVAPGSASAVADIDWPDPDDVIQPLKGTLNRKIPSLQPGKGVAEEALRREIHRLAPASRDWSKPGGARDAVIWLTALEAAGKGETVYLVSGDGRAFGKNGRLLAELQTEVDACDGKIIYCAGLSALFNVIAERRELSLLPEQLVESEFVSDVVKRELFGFAMLRVGPWSGPDEPPIQAFLASQTEPEVVKPPYDVHAYRVEETTWVAFRGTWFSKLTFVWEESARLKMAAGWRDDVTIGLTVLARLDADEQHVIGAEVLGMTRLYQDFQTLGSEALEDGI